MPFGTGNKLGQAYAKLKLDTSNFNRKLKSTQRNFKRSSGKMQSRAKKLGQSMKRMGMAAAAGAAAVGTAAVKMANSFGEAQKEAQQVFTLMDVSEEQFQTVRNEISDLSEEYGIMQTKGLEALYQITSATYKGEEATRIFAQAAEAGIAGATDQKTAADALTTVMNAYGKSVDDVESVSDTFFQTVRRGKTTFPELAKGISKVTSIAPQMGVSFEEAGAALATLTRAGQDTSEAVTNLGRLITEIGVKPADRLTSVVQDMGYEGESAAKKLLAEKGLYGAIQSIGEELDKQGKSWDQMLKRQQAMRAALVLTGKGAEGFAKDMDLMGKKAGSTEEAFDKMTETFWFKKKQLTAAFDDLVKSIGSKFAPAMTDLIENEMLPAIEEFDEWVGGVEGTKQKLTSFFEDATKVARGFFNVMTKIGGITITVSNWIFDLSDAKSTLVEKIKAAFGVGAMAAGAGLAAAVGFGLPGIIAAALITGWAAGNVYKLDPLNLKMAVNLETEANTEQEKKFGEIVGNLSRDQAAKHIEMIQKELKARGALTIEDVMMTAETEKMRDQFLTLLEQFKEKYNELPEAIGVERAKLDQLASDVEDTFSEENLDLDMGLYESNKSDIQKIGEDLRDRLNAARDIAQSVFGTAPQYGTGTGTTPTHGGRDTPTKVFDTAPRYGGLAESAAKARDKLKTFWSELSNTTDIAGIFGDETDVIRAKMRELRQKISEMIRGPYTRESERVQRLVKRYKELEGQLDQRGEEEKSFDQKMSDAATIAGIFGDEADVVKEKMRMLKRRVTEMIRGDYSKQSKKVQELMGRYEELKESLKEPKTALEKFANELGTTAKKIRSWGQQILSSLTSLIEQTGVLSDAQSELVRGMSQVAQDMMQGNWVKAIIDGITAIFASWITRLKKQLKELRKKLQAGYDMVNEALRSLGSEIENLVGGLFGPFGDALSGAINGLTGFVKMIQQGGETMEGTQSAFSAMLSIATGLIGSFTNLLQRSTAWEKLQKEMEPLWDALAEALSNLIWPVVALVDWIKDYLGIAEDVNEEMGKVSDLNVAEGFKRARTRWEAAETDQPATETGDGGPSIPQWAKEIIQPIKDALMPILDDLSNISISTWAQNVWGKINTLVAEQIPKVWKWIQNGVNWLKNNVDIEKIKNAIVNLYNWFTDNFQTEFQDALSNLDDIFGGEGLTGLEDKIETIKDKLHWLGRVLTAALGALAGAIVGALAAANPLLSLAVLGAGIAGGVAGGLLGWVASGGNLPQLQEGGIVQSQTPAMVGEAGPEAVIPLDRLDGLGSNKVIVDNTLELDGKVVYENQKEYEERNNYRKSGSTTGGGFSRA